MDIDSPDVARKIFEKLAHFAIEKKVSDIFINSNQNAAVKIDGQMIYLQDFFFDEQGVYYFLEAIAQPQAIQQFKDTHELNMMIEIKGLSYFRVNVYMQRNMPGFVMRTIPTEIPVFEDLKLPSILAEFSMAKRGLIILCGATGTGKSTTLASMIDYRNRHSQNHIITVEDPIEFMHKSKKSVVIQREVGIDTESYGAALKNSLRQAPDVIMIGEIRDSETMQYAMHFAESGHLCLATMHSTNSQQAIERLYNFFPRELRKQLQVELAHNLKAIITQRLLRRADGQGRIVSMEMMHNTPYIEHLIHEGELHKLNEAMKRGNEEDGVVTFDESLFRLYEDGYISYEEAKNYIESENDFRIMLRAHSKRPLPKELASSGQSFKVQDDAALEQEMLKKQRDELKKIRELRMQNLNKS